MVTFGKASASPLSFVALLSKRCVFQYFDLYSDSMPFPIDLCSKCLYCETNFLFVFTNWSMSHNGFLWSFLTFHKLPSLFYFICLCIIISWYRFMLLNSHKLQIHSLISNKRHFIKVSQYLIVAELIAHVTASNHTNWLACGRNDLSHVYSAKMWGPLSNSAKYYFPMRTWSTQESGNIFHEDRLSWGKKGHVG